jgi:hypothetical protein
VTIPNHHRSGSRRAGVGIGGNEGAGFGVQEDFVEAESGAPGAAEAGVSKGDRVGKFVPVYEPVPDAGQPGGTSIPAKPVPTRRDRRRVQDLRDRGGSPGQVPPSPPRRIQFPFQPGSDSRVLRKVGELGVEKQIRVDQDHR